MEEALDYCRPYVCANIDFFTLSRFVTESRTVHNISDRITFLKVLPENKYIDSERTMFHKFTSDSLGDTHSNRGCISLRSSCSLKKRTEIFAKNIGTKHKEGAVQTRKTSEAPLNNRTAYSPLKYLYYVQYTLASEKGTRSNNTDPKPSSLNRSLKSSNSG